MMLSRLARVKNRVRGINKDLSLQQGPSVRLRSSSAKFYSLAAVEDTPNLIDNTQVFTCTGTYVYECSVYFIENETKGCVKAYNNTLWRLTERTLNYAVLKKLTEEELSKPYIQKIDLQDNDLVGYACLLRTKPQFITQFMPLE